MGLSVTTGVWVALPGADAGLDLGLE